MRALLSRIRWDAAFARGRYEIGYVDRRELGLVRVPVAREELPAGSAFALVLEDESGEERLVPLHRVREVRRDGELIWQRLAPRAKPPTSRPKGPARKVARAVRPPRSRAAR